MKREEKVKDTISKLKVLEHECERARIETLYHMYGSEGYTPEQAFRLAMTKRRELEDIRGILFDGEA